MWSTTCRLLEKVHWKLHSLPKSRRVRTLTLLDAGHVNDVEQLVRCADAGGGTDELMERLTRLFERFPPDEITMRRLSLMQQEYEGIGNLLEFCVLCVYMAATEVVARITQKNTVPRIVSMPNLNIVSTNHLPRRHTSWDMANEY